MGNFETVRLGDVATYINGYAFKPSYWSDNGLPIIRIQNLTGNDYETNYYSGDYNKKYEVVNGDILISWSASLGVYEWKNEKALLNQHIFKVVFDKLPIDKSYFVHTVSYLLNDMLKETHGSTMKHITKPRFDNTAFPYPPLETQKQIAATLDKVTHTIDTCNAILEKLDLLVKSRFIELFGNPFLNPYNWEITKIQKAVTVEPQNGLYKPQSDYVDNNTGIPILRIDGFYNGKVVDYSKLKRLNCSLDEINKYILVEDDIVINRVNSIEHLGKCAHIKGLLEDTVFESNMMRMHFNEEKFSPVYVSHLLCSDFMYDQILAHAKKAVNQASINQKDVLDFDIYIPPLALQQQFAAFVEQTDKSKLAVKQVLEKAETLKKALMQEYFG